MEFLLGNIFFGLSEYTIHYLLHTYKYNGYKFNKSKKIYDNENYYHNKHHKLNKSKASSAFRDTIICLFASYFIPYQFIRGTLFGYICYKMVHVVQHKKNKFIPDLTGNNGRIFHYFHHNEIIYNYNFGVTTILYDYLYKTLHPSIELNILGYILGSIPILAPLTFRYGLKIKE